jgi:Domain of unknown function (DUF5134)
VDNTLRWVVTALFSVSLAAYAYFLVAQRRCWTSVVSQVLHLAMSAVMILMAWGIGMSLPTIAALVCFLLAGAWFFSIAGLPRWAEDGRLTNYYYAAMMAAMAWMYVAMSGSFGGRSQHAAADTMNMPAMPEMPGMPAMPASAHHMSATEATPEWVTMVNWFATLGFAAVALYWAYRWVTRKKAAAQLTRVQTVTQTCTAAGTALMFAALV